MLYTDSEWSYHGARPHHVVAAAVAVVLSVVLHAVLWWALPRWALPLPEAWRDRPLPAVRRLVVSEVRPAQHVERAPEAPPAGAAPEGLAAAVDRLGVAVPEGELAPRAPDKALDDAPPGLDVAAPLEAPPDWQPRQEILEIERRVAAEAPAALARQPTPLTERVARAPDIVLPATPLPAAGALGARSAVRQVLGSRPETAAITLPKPAEAGPLEPRALAVPTEAVVGRTRELFEETPGEITPLQPIEQLLQARVAVCRRRWDSRYGYVRVEIERLGPDVLPPIPKDVILMQDCSASMAEQRLYFCRQGWEECVTLLRPEDRFEVVSFRMETERCFGGWAANDAANRARASEFIRAMRAGGNTDLFSALRELLSASRTPGRPLVVLLASDGVATVGTTASSRIIGDFTRLNDGAVSLFTVGTYPGADRYLLDLLSYSNRGEVRMPERGRWSIPEAMRALMQEVSQPVLTDVSVRFPGGGPEVYPVQTANLYLDRPLVLFGRYPLGQERLVFQAVGQSLDRTCDMVFDLALGGEGVGEADRETSREWARQKLYHLIAEQAQNPDPDRSREIRDTAREYDVEIPYRGRF